VPERPALIDVRWAANFTLCPLYPVCLIPAAFHGLRLAGHLINGLGARRDAAPGGRCPVTLRANAGRTLSAALPAAATITEPMALAGCSMMLDSIENLRAAGFGGFETVHSLRDSRLAAVPASPGVYLVLCVAEPSFLARSSAGCYKGRDPTVAESALRQAWVHGARVIYIGKASTSLRTRLRAYLAHGMGRRAGHWGGRFIWQLGDSAALLVAWRVELDRSPREVERELIA